MNQIGCKLSSPASTVVDAIRKAFRKAGHFLNEAEFRDALYEELKSSGSCERECRAKFGLATAPALIPPLPFQVIDICEIRGCRKVDLVATLNSELVAIELKFSRFTSWKGSFRNKCLPNPTQSDIVPYGFLKDIHRMERLTKVAFGLQQVVPRYRVCVLLTNNPFEIEDRTIHKQMHLRPRTLFAGHLVQFNEFKKNGKPTSVNTLWRDYPPFCLAQSYVLDWYIMENDQRDYVPATDESRPYPSFQVLAVDVSSTAPN